MYERPEITRHDDGSSSWACHCGETVTRWRGQSDVQCGCGQWYNAGAQRLRSGWRDNASSWNEDVSDLDGYEDEQLRAEVY